MGSQGSEAGNPSGRDPPARDRLGEIRRRLRDPQPSSSKLVSVSRALSRPALRRRTPSRSGSSGRPGIARAARAATPPAASRSTLGALASPRGTQARPPRRCERGRRRGIARDLFREGLDLARRTGSRYWQARNLLGLGKSMPGRKNVGEARRCLDEALALLEAVRTPQAWALEAELNGWRTKCGVLPSA